MDLQVIVIAGSNDHLQSRGLLSRLTDGSIPSNEVNCRAIALSHDRIRGISAATLHQEYGEDRLCVIAGVRHIARALTVCVHDGHNSSRGTIQRDNTRAEQNSGPQ